MPRHRLYLDFETKEDMLETLEQLVASGIVPDVNVFPAAPADERKPHASYVLFDGVRPAAAVRTRKGA